MSVIVLHAINRLPEFRQTFLGMLHFPRLNMGLAVECFFVIGGFFLYKRLGKADAWALIKKTYLRLIPVMLFGFALCVACGTASFYRLPSVLAMTPGTALTPTVLSPGDWFIGVYFLVSCLYIGIFKAMPKWGWLMFGILLYIALIIKDHVPSAPLEENVGTYAVYFSFVGTRFILGMACMGVGIVAGFLSEKLACRPTWSVRLVFTAMEVFCLVNIYNALLNGRHYHLRYVELLVVVGVLLISISHSWGYLSAVLNKARWVQCASRYCFPALIGHIVCIKILNKYHHFGWEDGACAAFIIVGGILLGMVEYHFIEQGLVPAIKSRLTREQVQA